MKAKSKTKIKLNDKDLQKIDDEGLARVAGGLQGSPDWNEKRNKNAASKAESDAKHRESSPDAQWDAAWKRGGY